MERIYYYNNLTNNYPYYGIPRKAESEAALPGRCRRDEIRPYFCINSTISVSSARSSGTWLVLAPSSISSNL